MSKNHNEKMDMTRWRKVRLKVFDRDGWRCVDCGKSGRLECDHVKPLSAGGEMYALHNLASRCRT